MTGRDEVRDQLARALDSVLAAASTPIGRITPNQLADAAMAIVDPIVAERDDYRANGKEAAEVAFGVSEKLATVEAELAETHAAHRAALLGVSRPGQPTYEALEEHVAGLVQENGVLRGEIADLETGRLQWAVEAIDADTKTDYVRWLHAEAVWQLKHERFRATMLRAAVVRELHTLADLDGVTTADIETLADHIEAGDWLEGDPGPIAAPTDRESLGRLVRKVWIGWASEQPNPKPSWLVPREDLSEPDREVDRRIGETLARAGISAGLVARTPSDLQVPPSLGETAPNPLCEKCRCRGVQYPDRPSSVFGHFCLTCIGKCHDMSDESSVHMCVIDRWEPARGTGTEADNAQ